MNAPVSTSSPAALDLVMTRRIPAAPARVFAAWTEPEQVRQWWGPYGMTTPVCELDLRPGGTFRTLMRDASGAEYPSEVVFDEIIPPSRLAVRIPAGKDGPLAGAVATIAFEDEAAGTRLAVRWTHASAAAREAHERMGFVKGWGETLDRLTAHVLRPALNTTCPMQAAPEPEHGWLHRLLGTWRYEVECSMGPDQPPERTTGVERVRSLGGFWVVGESEGEMPGGSTGRMIMTLGWDAGARRFRGTFVGSMMPNMFVYEGTLDAETRTLMLETEGPSFTGAGTARYRDVIEMRGDDERVLSSSVLGEDGAWTTFMNAQYRREA